MVAIDIIYDSSLDTKTPAIAEELKGKFGDKVTVRVIDAATEATPEKYGIINPPEVFIDGKTRIKLEGRDSVERIVSKVIF